MDSLSSVLPNAVRILLRQGPMSPGKLRLAWRVAVGAAIDRVTTVSMDDHKVVQVVAPDATWRRELKRSQALILSRLRDLVGADEVASVKILGKSGKE